MHNYHNSNSQISISLRSNTVRTQLLYDTYATLFMRFEIDLISILHFIMMEWRMYSFLEQLGLIRISCFKIDVLFLFLFYLFDF